jgi:CO/xanthine dehydrogenase FAD-binding subunit
MRTFLPWYELRAVRSLDECLRTLTDEPGVWRPFAGGTDLMVLMEAGKLPRTHYLSIWGLSGLRGITVSSDAVALGALTTYADVLAHPVLVSEFPLLARAAAETGGVATQNRGTIGGNLANASPAADTPPALLVYDAELELVSAGGIRRIPYHRFHIGYKAMDLAPDEIISSIHLPRGRGGWTQTYRKVGTRRAQAISKVCLAAAASLRHGVIDDIRIAFGSVAPTVVRCRAAEDLLRTRRVDPVVVQAACDAILRDIAPIEDVRSTAAYRRRVAQNLVAEFLTALVSQ